MTTATPEKAEGLKALQNAIEVIEKQITSLGGVFQVQMPVGRLLFLLLLNFNRIIKYMYFRPV